IGEHIELKLALAEDAGSVKADPSQLEQVLVNLALNARDAMPEGSTLTIATANLDLTSRVVGAGERLPAGRYVALSVTDTGWGMDEATRSRIFEPFFTTKPAGQGAGLGLAVAYGIVRQHGGGIEVESEPGKGSTFRVYLPRVEERQEQLAPRAEAAAEGKPRGNETLLLLEDEPGVRRMTRRALESLGYVVLEATDPQSAIEIGRNHAGPIYMLVTDVILPEMSGRQVAERLAALRLGIKVLYLSGYSDGEIARAGVLEEGLNFLPKPFALDELARKVREVLDEAALSGPF
ncbi:MAG: ATP-binding protein, partial [Bryobacteraceae bacterium]